MSKKDYELIARSLSESKRRLIQYGWALDTVNEMMGFVVSEVADALKSDNARFNRDIFVEAARV